MIYSGADEFKPGRPVLPYVSVFALLVALAVSVLPTLLYLGLWRGLVRLRENALQRYGDPTESGQPAGPRASASTAGDHGGSPATATCPHCGTDNDGYATFCVACLRKL